MVAKAVLAPDLGYDRWILVDDQTGEILDDAQGYGYKSAAGAHRAYAYKTMPKKKKNQRNELRKRVQRFWRKHNDLSDDIAQAALWAFKDGEEFTDKDAMELIKESGVDLEGLTPAQLVRDM